MPWAASVVLPRLWLSCSKIVIMLHSCPQTFTGTEVVKEKMTICIVIFDYRKT